MPLFEFECTACGERFEELIRDDQPLATCPSCNSGHTEKVFSAPSRIPGTGPNRLPGALTRSGGPKMQFQPRTVSASPPCGGGCSKGRCNG